MNEIDKDAYHDGGKKRKKKEGPKRTDVIHVRLFPDEKKRIDEKVASSGKSISELIRHSLDTVKVTSIKNTSIQKELIREVRRIGINLNQIARACNNANKNGDEINMVELIILLRQIENNCDGLLSSSSPPAPSFDFKKDKDSHDVD